ncbi:hypothetical protein K458DRAFT_177022 [Lentithecium fluviatile CBS 122367]|uniref:Uncharacterized protein n=1 Tax=Lentithecium fluviatile CBS 122367 TaxID=1168545 RepID=A0A6G1JDM9_9PLEO|nr:hypothetical protein K458DRAFT_177022 [Lentithecium fluviatile CBS 122367]
MATHVLPPHAAIFLSSKRGRFTTPSPHVWLQVLRAQKARQADIAIGPPAARRHLPFTRPESLLFRAEHRDEAKEMLRQSSLRTRFWASAVSAASAAWTGCRLTHFNYRFALRGRRAPFALFAAGLPRSAHSLRLV